MSDANKKYDIYETLLAIVKFIEADSAKTEIARESQNGNIYIYICPKIRP